MKVAVGKEEKHVGIKQRGRKGFSVYPSTVRSKQKLN